MLGAHILTLLAILIAPLVYGLLDLARLLSDAITIEPALIQLRLLTVLQVAFREHQTLKSLNLLRSAHSAADRSLLMRKLPRCAGYKSVTTILTEMGDFNQ
jgi:hypothetical protein